MPSPCDPAGLSGLKIIVIEDEALVALNLESMLEDLGCTVVGPFMRYAQAETMIERSADADAAILDVNIGGQKVFPIAQKLVEKGVPIIFATGYGRAGLPEAWHDRPVLQKPYTEAEVALGLKIALDSAKAGRVCEASR